MGIIKNFKEVFFSKIPPSMINFRAWVSEDDSVAMGSFSSELGGRAFDNRSKEKFDFRTRNEFETDGSSRVVKFLQNMDYTGIDDKLKKKMEDGDTDS